MATATATRTDEVKVPVKHEKFDSAGYRLGYASGRMGRENAQNPFDQLAESRLFHYWREGFFDGRFDRTGWIPRPID